MGEIEVALRAHPRVKHAIAVVQRHAESQRLVAFVVPELSAAGRPESIDIQDLRATAIATLPDYMVPADFVVLDTLPLTANGKLDRQALQVTDTIADNEHVEPTEPIDRLLCELVAGLLHTGRVGLTANFFHLGGDSISAIRLVAIARQRGLQLEPREIFLHPVLGDLGRTAKYLSDLAVPDESTLGPLVAL